MNKPLTPSAFERMQASDQRRAHLRDRPAGCECLWCVGLRATMEAARRRWVEESNRNGDPPF